MENLAAFLQPERGIPSIVTETVFSIGNFNVTGSLVTSFLVLVLFVLASLWVKNNTKERPGKIQALVEILYTQAESMISQFAGSKDLAQKIFPITGAMFLYLILANIITLIPGLGQITFGDVSLFATPTADFNTPFALAFASILVIQFVSIKDYGLFPYLNRFVPFGTVVNGFKKGIKQGFGSFVDFFLGVIDIIGEVAKVISLAFRLFGNMYAGGVLMIVLTGMVSILVPALWLGMSLFSGVIQALVFSALVTVYYTLSLKPKAEESPGGAALDVTAN